MSSDRKSRSLPRPCPRTSSPCPCPREVSPWQQHCLFDLEWQSSIRVFEYRILALNSMVVSGVWLIAQALSYRRNCGPLVHQSATLSYLDLVWNAHWKTKPQCDGNFQRVLETESNSYCSSFSIQILLHIRKILFWRKMFKILSLSHSLGNLQQGDSLHLKDVAILHVKY